MDYECHITVSTEHAEKATQIARALHWKTSEIARDPLLGDANFFYLTTHDNDPRRIFIRMETCSAELEIAGTPVLREKIELVLHDTKKKRIRAADVLAPLEASLRVDQAPTQIMHDGATGVGN